jgi:hypothetical protein
MPENYRESFADLPDGGIGMVYDGDSVSEARRRLSMHPATQKERREREKADVLARLRAFAGRSKWKKARISRELGVSLSSVDRWLGGHEKILLASMLAIRRFLQERERLGEGDADQRTSVEPYTVAD